MTFRVLAVLTSLWLLAMSVFALMEIVLMLLPGDTLLSMIDDLTPADLAHRTHFMNAGVIAWAVVLGVFVQLRRRPGEAPMLHALTVALGASVLFAPSGSLGTGCSKRPRSWCRCWRWYSCTRAPAWAVAATAWGSSTPHRSFAEAAWPRAFHTPPEPRNSRSAG